MGGSQGGCCGAQGARSWSWRWFFPSEAESVKGSFSAPGRRGFAAWLPANLCPGRGPLAQRRAQGCALPMKCPLCLAPPRPLSGCLRVCTRGLAAVRLPVRRALHRAPPLLSGPLCQGLVHPEQTSSSRFRPTRACKPAPPSPCLLLKRAGHGPAAFHSRGVGPAQSLLTTGSGAETQD